MASNEEATTIIQEGPEKDADTPKLFVGQIPRTFTEKDLRPMFEEYGPVHSFNILTDKFSGVSKGCGFLIFVHKADAERCMEDLHGKKTLLGMVHALQVKLADSETRDQENRKLFVGMLSREHTEDDVKQLFSKYGGVEDVTILNNPDGSSKACGFVKMETRDAAQAAINALHNYTTFPGARSPFVCKFADTEKDKLRKREQLMASASSMGMGMMGFGGPQMGYGGFGRGAGMGGAGMGGFGGGMDQYGASAPDMSAAMAGVQQFQTGYGQQPYAQQNNFGAQRPGADRSAGPEGANLFIYHLPQDFNDAVLAATFMPFGNVVSAKVFVDKMTGQSKCFGFVSYDNAISAASAIQAMNGFQVGNKRLQVSIKKAGRQNPY